MCLLALGWQNKFNSDTKCNRKHNCVTVLLRSLSKVSGIVLYAESQNQSYIKKRLHTYILHCNTTETGRVEAMTWDIATGANWALH